MTTTVSDWIVRVVVFAGSAAVGLLLAALLIPDMSLHIRGFAAALITFAVVQSVLTSLIFLPSFPGGAALLATGAALGAASLFGGLTITGWRAWVLATLVVWLATAVAAVLLPKVLVRGRSRANRPTEA